MSRSTLIPATRCSNLQIWRMQRSHNGFVLLMVAFSMLFTSCASDNNEADIVLPSQLSRINLALSTGTLKTSNNSKTRTSGSLPTDDGSDTQNYEGNLKGNNICVGLFNSTNGLVTLHEYTYQGATESIETRTEAVKMVVWANIPKGTFAGKYKLSDFYSTPLDLSCMASAATTANSQYSTKLPMLSGENPLIWASTTIGIGVNLTRKVARVALASINTSITSGYYTGATFTPTEIFMYNASNSLTNWNTNAVSGNVSGESNNANTSYLGSGVIATYSSVPYYFYVFPHSATTPTRLVVKGMFKPSGGSSVLKYYPVIVNHTQTNGAIVTTGTSGTDSQIDANTRYDISITINGIGVDHPNDDLEPAKVTVTTTTSKMTPATMGISF